jgi:hypothetical protein
MTAGSSVVAGSNFCTPVGNGWYRCGFSFAAIATLSGAAVVTTQITSMSDTRVPSYGGTGTYLRWGGQYESTSAMGSATFATSFIYTNTTAVTRAADTASMTGTNFSSWYNQTEGTFVVEFDYLANPAADLQVFCAANAGATNLLGVRHPSAASQTIIQRVPGTIDITLGAPVANTTTKIANSYSSTATAGVLNGGTVVTGAAWTVSDLNQLGIGNRVGSQFLNGHIRRLQYIKTAVPETTLKALST